MQVFKIGMTRTRSRDTAERSNKWERYSSDGALGAG
jgi:hypothetical protein